MLFVYLENVESFPWSYSSKEIRMNSNQNLFWLKMAKKVKPFMGNKGRSFPYLLHLAKRYQQHIWNNYWSVNSVYLPFPKKDGISHDFLKQLDLDFSNLRVFSFWLLTTRTKSRFSFLIKHYIYTADFLEPEICVLCVRVCTSLLASPFFALSPGAHLTKLIGLCRPVIIAMVLLPFVDSLVFQTESDSYSRSHANQFFEAHKGE